MADLQVTNVFNTGDTVSATNFNTNYSDIVTYINNRNSGSSTWDAFYCTSATNVPLTANNSTGTQSIVQMKDNGTTVFEVFDGGIITMSSQTYGKITKTGDQSLSSDGTLITFTSEDQVGTSFSSSRFTCPSSGKYLVSVNACVSETTTAGVPLFTSSGFYVSKNGSQVYSQTCDNYQDGVPNFVVVNFNYTDILSLLAGDYIEAYANHTPYTGSGAETIRKATSVNRGPQFFSFAKLS